MDITELLKKLEENTTVIKPVAVDIPGLGTLYIRRRTVFEFEQMSTLKTGEGAGKNGVFAPALARLLCDENGQRFGSEHEAVLVSLLAQQPEEVFHKLIEASDGRTAQVSKEDPQNPN